MTRLSTLTSPHRLMTQKIKFQVVYATGSDDDYSSSALEDHGPSVKGWRSERFCVFPQELVLQLPSCIRVRKLQLLSHQFLIARKVELYVGECRRGGSVGYQSASFDRLGYISFESNEKTQFKARELKSVHLDCTGTFVKLVCQKNHVNKHNIFNQVGIVAVNVIGEYLSNSPDKPESYRDINIANENTDPVVMGNINKPSNMSLIDDITFGVYQDPEVARVIQKLERKKHLAIEEEKYDFAKRLKQAIGDLYKVGEKLGRLEKEKKAAVTEENYDLAQAKKIQADEIRVVVFQQLNIQSLLQSDRLLTDDTPHVLVRSPPHQLPALPDPSPAPPPTYNNPPYQQPPSAVPSHHSDGSYIAAPDQVPEQPVRSRGGDRPIPTLANKTAQELEEEEVETPRDPDGPDEHSMKVAHDLNQAVDLFGQVTVACLFCKQFALREKGINQISETLSTLETSSPTYSVRALIQVFQQAFTDPVYNTLTVNLDVFKSLLKRDVLSKGHTTELCNQTLPILLKRVGENVRNRELITSSFLEISKTKHLMAAPTVPNITVSVCKEKNPKVLTARLVLLENQIENSGLEQSSYTVELVMKFVAPALTHTARDVRDAAIKITLLMYRQYGDPVRKHLPKDEPILRKKQLIWKKIFESFDEIDGKPVHKPNEPTAEDKKAAQVAALKAELASLREMAAGANIEVPEELKEGNEHMKMKPGGGIKKKKKAPPGKPAPIAEEKPGEPEIEDTLDKTCMFCNEHNEKFNAETLDVHFWRSCPMLSRCSHCSQVVEIAGTTTHLLTECTAQDKFQPCKDCQLAVETGSEHTCSVQPGEGETLCPLCMVSVKDGEEGWREHLMSADGCRSNSRREQKK